MITIIKGNLLEAPVEALVNAVNCVGAAGKGIAEQFKYAYPQNYRAYYAACIRRELRPGNVFAVRVSNRLTPQWILNVATKGHWRRPSTPMYIDIGLTKLIRAIQELHIKSIAIPALGCGEGGLDWTDVRPRIEAAFAQIPDVRVLLYEPRI